ncbi:arylsulfatase H-like [Bradysia coprophila]|uniref:arylsulfatase H-like n=1 Tax=Bradysia coprophila TaxID=38358 RepID=UPI00187D7C88|nr:arylsulfatase H-like [Bradysia coprophila]
MNPLIGVALALLQFINVSIGARPNILILLVDDLGYGDLGCYGNSTITSVHIDSLAREGALFTQMYAGASICTPSRGSLLTGRYAIRLGLTSNDNRFRTFNSPAQTGGLPHDETTLAEVAKRLGYRTGLIGKWHLGLGRGGEHLPIRHGFDSFFGMPVTNVQSCGNKTVYNLIGNHGEIIDRSFVAYWILLTGKVWMAFIVFSITSWFFARKLAIIVVLLGTGAFAVSVWYTLSFTLISTSSCLLYRNEDIIEQPVHLENLTLRNTNEAIKFIKDAILTPDQKPFFLFMSYIKVHTALFTLPENTGRSLHGPYGDNVEELDWSVGRILETLRMLNVDNDTLVFFTSDNGPFLERGTEAGFCGRATTISGTISEPLRGAKGQTWECGIRVPGIVRWPSQVVPGQVVHSVTSLLDIFPSLLEIWNVPPKSRYPLDGVSVWPHVSLTKDAKISLPLTTAKERDSLFHYCGSTITALRLGKFKAHYWTPVWDAGFQACPSVTICPCLGTQHTPPLLFDIDADPGETLPLDVNKHLEVLSSMDRAIRKHQETIVPVTNQVETLGLPWLFPCCNAHGWTRIFRLVTNSCRC